MKNFTTTVTKLSSLLFIGIILLSSCEDDNPKREYRNGVFISNEGAHGNDNGSVSFYSYDSDEVTNNIFEASNSKKLGDVLQSITISDENAYLVVNASNKVEVVNNVTFEEKTIIEGCISPRYLTIDNNKAFLSCWGDNSVKVIDLLTNSITKTIPVGSGPENMIIADKKLYVANSGGWGTDSIISVIDLNSEEVVDSITVKYSPRDFEVDKDGFVWALCFGKVVYGAEDPYPILEESPSKIYKIDPSNNSVVLDVTLFENQHPSILEIDNDGSTLYVGGGSAYVPIHKLVINEQSVTATKIINEFPYGFAYDKNNDILFVTVVPNWTGAGNLYRYATDGTKKGTYSVGIGPSGAAFKKAK